MPDINALAIEIADEAATMDLGAHCRLRQVDGAYWIDTTFAQRSETDKAVVDRATRYLAARGMLLRHPTQTMLVRTRPVSA